MKWNRLPVFAALLCAAAMLAGCSELIPSRGQNADLKQTYTAEYGEKAMPAPETEALQEQLDVESLTITVTESTISQLENYPNLKKLDLLDSTCYTKIMSYIRKHPEVDVTYYVNFGKTSAVNWVESIALKASDVRYETVMKNLAFLPELKSVHFPGTGLTKKQLDDLKETYPGISFSYTVVLDGVEIPADAVALDLSSITAEVLPEVISALERLPNLSDIELMDSAGNCSLTRQQVAVLKSAVPAAHVHYQFDLFGRSISTNDVEVYFKGLSLSEANESEIREAMSLLSPGSSLILDSCGLSSEFLDSIRRDYENVDLVWRVYFGTQGRYTTLTNDDTIRCVYNVTDDTCYEMRWLRSVRFMDLGHNDTLTDLSFLGYMPELEIVILSGCAAKNLAGVENCKKLELLELANCLSLDDISALAGCESLKYLNICYTKVKSLESLEELDIQNLFCKQTRVSYDEQMLFKETHPDSTAVFTGREAYAGPGWRYIDNGYTFTDFYKRVREVFNLDAVDQTIRAQESTE